MMPAAFRMSAVAVGLLLTLVAAASARPFYFDTFTTFYGLTEGEDLYACGVCHRLWTGTGGRNPFGLEIEQQLYTGKTISDAILSVELLDTDLDGFTNVDEISVHGTLPGYSCDNYQLAIEPPANFQSFIEPFVPTCLEPKDIEVLPSSISFNTELGETHQRTVQVINNGFSAPINVTDISFFPSPPPTMSLTTPPLPFAIGVGSSAATIDISFTPVAATIIGTTVRITSDDPDEPIIDVPISAIGFFIALAPAQERANCLGDMSKRLQKYSKTHMKEWARCYTDEAAGKACNAGKRDLKLQKAEVKLRRVIGGDRDKFCEARELLPSLLGFPNSCPAPCESIVLTQIADVADCLVCQQEAATSAMLAAASGVVPPDLPDAGANLLVAKCARQLSKGVEKASPKIHKALAACELDNITAVSPVDCATANAAEITKRQNFANSRIDRCKDTTGLTGCPFGMGADPDCLGDAALSIASDLVDLTFSLD